MTDTHCVLRLRVVCAFVSMTALAHATGMHGQSPRAPTVIESAAPLWTAATALKVEAKPLLTLGNAETLFSSVSSAHRYADGRIVVADSMAKELIMFDAKGQSPRKIARPGSGPGEFQAFGRILPAGGDSIAVWDWRTRRMTYFGERGQLLRSSAPATPTKTQLGKITVNRYPRVIGRFANGSLLAQQNTRGNSPEVSAKSYDSITYFVMTVAAKKPIGDFFTGESWQYFHLNGDVTFDDSPFARVGAVAVGPGSFFISDGAQFEVTEHDKSGAALRVMRIRRTPLPVTAAQIAEYKKNFHASDKQHNEIVLKWMTYPKTHPAFNQLLRDTDGRIWAGNYDLNPAVSRFDVFDANGKWLGTVAFPDNSTLLEAGTDWVLLRVLAPSGEPLVQLHRLIRAQ